MRHERKNNLFKVVPAPNVRRNLFDLSHEVKMSGKFGYLYPILCVDTLPGDTFRDTMQAMVRMAPMLAPVMHRLDVSTHFFFVPNRLVSNQWENFITGGQDGTDAPVLPYVTPATIKSEAGDDYMKKGSLWDYFGLPIEPDTPPAVWSANQISVLPFRAYMKIWNDYYRDPNFDDERDLGLNSVGNVAGTFAGIASIMRRGFEKDYFTSALPFAQRGAQVLMPLAGTGTAEWEYKFPSKALDAAGDPIGANTPMQTTGLGNIVAGATQMTVDNLESIDVDIDGATTTINDFRRALAIQRWLEANARGGARYVEQILSHFDVQVPDYRLQRAEYLGGGKQPIQISEVLATAESESVPVGDMAGHGISVGRTNTFTYRCQEHGHIIGILSVTMRTAYSQGIPRLWSRQDKFDFGWPELANLGEQEIVNKEVFFSFNADDDDDNATTFGYIPRYAEYKFMNDRIAGDFRTTLGFWHLTRKFLQRPSLDEYFTTIYQEGGPGAEVYEESFDRIFAVQDGTDYLWMQLYHRLTAKRPLPYFGVPSI